MILVYPQNADWDYIAQLTGDKSWRAEKMRAYFERLEHCAHRPFYRWLAKLGINPTRHGWRGWLVDGSAVDIRLLANQALARTHRRCWKAFKEDGQQPERIRWLLESGLDPNDWRLVRDNSTGIRYLPLTTHGHARTAQRTGVGYCAAFPDG